VEVKVIVVELPDSLRVGCTTTLCTCEQRNLNLNGARARKYFF
jgi:hypothetical protein